MKVRPANLLQNLHQVPPSVKEFMVRLHTETSKQESLTSKRPRGSPERKVQPALYETQGRLRLHRAPPWESAALSQAAPLCAPLASPAPTLTPSISSFLFAASLMIYCDCICLPHLPLITWSFPYSCVQISKRGWPGWLRVSLSGQRFCSEPLL